MFVTKKKVADSGIWYFCYIIPNNNLDLDNLESVQREYILYLYFISIYYLNFRSFIICLVS